MFHGYFNPFLANVPILYPLKTPENHRYKMGTLARNGLIYLWLNYDLNHDYDHFEVRQIIERRVYLGGTYFEGGEGGVYINLSVKRCSM